MKKISISGISRPGNSPSGKYYGASLEVLGFYWSAVSSLQLLLTDNTPLDTAVKMRCQPDKSGQVLRTLKAHDESVTSPAINTLDGRFAISGRRIPLSVSGI